MPSSTRVNENSGHGAQPAGTDRTGRRVPSEGNYTYEDRSGVTAERGRGHLSGDGRMHGH